MQVTAPAGPGGFGVDLGKGVQIDDARPDVDLPGISRGTRIRGDAVEAAKGIVMVHLDSAGPDGKRAAMPAAEGTRIHLSHIPQAERAGDRNRIAPGRTGAQSL